MQTTKNYFSTVCSRDQSVIGNSAEVTQATGSYESQSHEYDLLRYCRLPFSRYFTENCASILDTMMLTLFFFKSIFPVGKLIEDIIGDLLGKH